MYISVNNAIFNITLVFQYIGNYSDADRLGTIALYETKRELMKIPLDIIGSSVNTYVYTGTTNGSRCALIILQFSVLVVWPIELQGKASFKTNLLNSIIEPKRYILSSKITLNRITENYNCSMCKLDNTSLTSCNSTSKIVPMIDQALLTRKHNFTCPYFVLGQNEYDILKRRKIISSVARVAWISNKYRVCVSDVKFETRGSLTTNDTTGKYRLFGWSVTSAMSILLVLVLI